MASSRTGSPIVADTASLSRLARNLRKAAPESWAACRTSLRAAAEPVAADARGRASFSTRIPGSISVRVGGSGSVKVVAGGAQAPDGAPLENRGQPGEFRHPVFGTDRWVSQRARPFLGPAADANRDEVAGAVASAVMEAVDRALRGK